jgi:hypothetical protein
MALSSRRGFYLLIYQTSLILVAVSLIVAGSAKVNPSLARQPLLYNVQRALIGANSAIRN